jgi:nickel/cobalt transporter (NiCoT) family protein
LINVFNDEPSDTRLKVTALYGVLIAVNAASWLWALIAFRSYPVLLGTALLAYTFGLRHAVDADHIAAIDNVTRKLMQSGKRPISAGFFFSLGHSTVVIAASIALALAVTSLQGRFEHFKEIGGVIGTSVSALFLITIAAANTFILVRVWRMFCAVRRGERLIDEELNLLLSQHPSLVQPAAPRCCRRGGDRDAPPTRQPRRPRRRRPRARPRRARSVDDNPPRPVTGCNP